MRAFHFTQTTTATPEPFIGGLTDFGPGRKKLFCEQRRRLARGGQPGSH
jgi:hypothetical protein